MLRIIKDINDDNKFTKSFINRMVQECEKQNEPHMIVEVGSSKEMEELDWDNYPTVICEPFPYQIPYKYAYWNMDNNSTFKAICDTVKSYPINKTVLIVNRSELIGLPLKDELLRRGVDYTVGVAHSKTPKDKLQKLINAYDIVVFATGHKCIDMDLTSCEVIIDASNDVKSIVMWDNVKVLDCDYYDQTYIGKLTVENIVKNAKARG